MAPDAVLGARSVWQIDANTTVAVGPRKGVVIERAMELIRTGTLKAGDRLPPEGDLAVSFGVSRTVIREAMKSLEAVGVVRIEQGRGTFVANNPLAQGFSLMATMNLHRLDELYEVRKIIEAETVSRAAVHATPNDHATMARAVEAFNRGLVERNRRAVIEADCAFHLAIAGACGLGLLTEILAVTVPIWTSVIPNPSFERAAISGYEHELIVKAVSASDASGARLAMVEHIEGAYRRLHAATEGSKEVDALH